MINITTRICLSKKSKKIIKRFLKRDCHGHYDVNSWDKIPKSVKNEFSKRLFYNQNNKCVYCGRYLPLNAPEMDHFAHKARYPQFSFTAINVFYSCRFCNSPTRKGQKPTIRVLHDNYRQCNFSIVHPYLNNPDNEIFYKDVDRIDIDWFRCTPLGKVTINFFGYHDSFYTGIRSQNHILSVFSPYTSEQEKEQIQKSIAYK